jgi:hypothetical protein
MGFPKLSDDALLAHGPKLGGGPCNYSFILNKPKTHLETGKEEAIGQTEFAFC